MSGSKRSNRGGSPDPACGRHHLTGWGPKLNNKTRVANTSFQSLSFLSGGAMWPDASCFCLNAFPTMTAHALMLWTNINSSLVACLCPVSCYSKERSSQHSGGQNEKTWAIRKVPFCLVPSRTDLHYRNSILGRLILSTHGQPMALVLPWDCLWEFLDKVTSGGQEWEEGVLGCWQWPGIHL